VDVARAATDPAFSLYETYWQLRLAARCGRGSGGVRAASVQAWLGPALDGQLDASGLPPVAQIDYATQILGLLGGSTDAAGVARAIERLRAGGGYRTGPAAAAPDWGSTALAVSVLNRLGLQVPAAVLRSATAAAVAGPAGGESLPQLIALAQLAAQLAPGPGSTLLAAAQRLVGIADRGLQVTGQRPDAAWLVLAAGLRQAAAALGTAVTAAGRQVGGRLAGARDGGVPLPGQLDADPQATFAALELGCPAWPRVTARSRAGWPPPAAAADPGPSAAALRIAREIGFAGRFREPLRRQLDEVWLWQANTADDAAARMRRVNLRQLAAGLGPQVSRRAARSLPRPVFGPGHDAGGDAALLLALLELASSAPLPAERAAAMSYSLAAARRGGAPVLIRAAWLALAGRLFDDPVVYGQGACLARRLRWGEGVYAASPAAAPSLTASAMGVWIERPADHVLLHWRAAGICPDRESGATGERPSAAGQLSLRALAIMLAARRRRYGELLPFAL
jgi:hypothetical protein